MVQPGFSPVSFGPSVPFLNGSMMTRTVRATGVAVFGGGSAVEVDVGVGVGVGVDIGDVFTVIEGLGNPGSALGLASPLLQAVAAAMMTTIANAARVRIACPLSVSARYETETPRQGSRLR